MRILTATFLVAAFLAALIALDTEPLDRCQERSSFATCFTAMNR